MIIQVEANKTAFRKFPDIGAIVKCNKHGQFVRGRRGRYAVGVIVGYEIKESFDKKVIRPTYTIELLTNQNASNYIVDRFFEELGKETNEN